MSGKSFRITTRLSSMNKKSPIHLVIISFGLFMFICSFAIGAAGYINKYVCTIFIEPVDDFLNDFYANLSTDFLFTAITILIIDGIYNLRDIEREKETLILDMGSSNNSVAKKAVRSLRNHRNRLAKKSWIEDGTLRGADFKDADLSNCDLHKADLRGAAFNRAELEEANLTDADLRDADFSVANLKEADLRRANLRGADFTDAEMEKTNLCDALVDDGQFDFVDGFCPQKDQTI